MDVPIDHLYSRVAVEVSSSMIPGLHLYIHISLDSRFRCIMYVWTHVNACKCSDTFRYIHAYTHTHIYIYIYIICVCEHVDDG